MFSRLFPLAALSLALATFSQAAESKFTAYLDPANAGPDYPFQGEYVGDRCGAQVIALGDGKFHIIGWSEGLPGDAEGAERKAEVDAKRDGDTVSYAENGWTGNIKGDTLTGYDDKGNTRILKKVERKSPTLGEKPPAGAIALFDGTNADAWEGGQMDERHLLAGGTKTKQLFQDFHLHVEFRTPFMPDARGQARGNSGVYLQNRYECQVLDSFALNGENNEAGAIYHQSKPRLNMCFPPLTWQTYDVDFTAAKYDTSGMKTKNAIVTLRHNGVVVQDNLEITGDTPGAGLKETADPGPILLQNHGNPVFFQNIWIAEKK
jgi:hypothetical protein